MAINEKLLKEIEQMYNIKSQFSLLFLQRFFEGKDISNISSISDIVSMPDQIPMYFNYAMSTNLRGREAVKLLLPYLKSNSDRFQLLKKTKRYLDVGCAYGGFLVAFAEQGFDPIGIEIDPRLAQYGEVNCKEHGLPDCVIQGDFLSYDIEKLGKFDVITCNDVIEHVRNPELAIERLASLLNNGGVLFLEIPNKNCIKLVEKDGHYCIFGLTLLQHNIAKDYRESITKDMKYDVEEYFELGYYLDHLSQQRLKTSVITRYLAGNMDDVPRLLNDLSVQFNHFYYDYDKKANYPIYDTLVNGYFEYLEHLYRDYRTVRTNGGSADFIKKYLASTWSIVAVKE